MTQSIKRVVAVGLITALCTSASATGHLSGWGADGGVWRQQCDILREGTGLPSSTKFKPD